MINKRKYLWIHVPNWFFYLVIESMNTFHHSFPLSHVSISIPFLTEHLPLLITLSSLSTAEHAPLNLSSGTPQAANIPSRTFLWFIYRTTQAVTNILYYFIRVYCILFSTLFYWILAALKFHFQITYLSFGSIISKQDCKTTNGDFFLNYKINSVKVW